MKTLSKIIVLTFLIVSVTQVRAQVKIGLKAGLNMANIAQNYEDALLESETKTRLAYHIGASVDYNLSDTWGIQSGLLFTSKGYSYDLEQELGITEEESLEGYDRVTFNYLEIPVSLAYKENNLQLYAGPYLAVGIGGKNKWDYTINYEDIGDVQNEEGKVKYKPVFGEANREDFAGDESPLNALDFGFNFGVGYEVGAVRINVGYSLGLSNMIVNYEGGADNRDRYESRNRAITVSASYFFKN